MNGRGEHPNSRAAHEMLVQEDLWKQQTGISRRMFMVLETLQTLGSATDRQLKNTLFGRNGDMNQVRPRISEAVEYGYAKEVDSVRCPFTGKEVRVIQLSGLGTAALARARERV